MRRASNRVSLASSTIALALVASGALAVQPDEVMPDPRLEARAREVSAELRCLVCQNQSIDDSDAPLARDLRLLVRERIRAGDSDAGIRDFVVGRYGQFVLLRPTVEANTLLLWAGPFAIVLAGIAGLVFARRKRVESPPIGLTPDEAGRIDALLRDERS